MLVRHKKILKALLRAERYVSVTSLANELHCSEKTVRNDLKVLDDWLQRYALKIERKPSIGIRLTGDGEAKATLLRDVLNDSEEGLSHNERHLQLLKWLLTADKPVTIQQLANQFYISKSTIHADLEEIGDWLHRFQLKLIRKPHLGIKVEGEEKNWRAALSRLIELLVDRSHYMLNEHQLSMIADVLQPYEMALIEKEVQQTEKYLAFPLTDQAIVSLTIHIAIAVKRIKKGYEIQMDSGQWKELQAKKEYEAAERLARKIETWLAIKIPQAEIGYITLHLLGARIRYDQVHVQEGAEQFLSKVDREALHITRLLIANLSRHMDGRLSDDQELLLGLTIHLHSTLNRLRNGFSVTNPMLREIKQMYRYTFELVLASMKEIEKQLRLSIPEDEIAYVVLHIQAAVERIQNNDYERKRVMIVCPTGAGTSRLIEAKFSAAFPDVEVVGIASIMKLKEAVKEKQPDLLISTAPLLLKTDVPSVIVSPLLREHELQMIKDHLFKLRRQPLKLAPSYETMKSSIRPHMIFLDLLLTDRWQVIDYLAEQLHEYGYVEREYKQSAKEREKLSSTYIGGGIAIPHGEAKWIKRSTLAVARLCTPIDWDGDKVELVIMIANRPQETEQMKRLFQELANLSEDEETLTRLKHAETIQQFYHCL